jgi:hypothetical protein
MAHRIPHADGLQQDSIQQIPHFDVSVQRAGDQLERVVRIQYDRCYCIRVTPNVSFRRECRYDEPGGSRMNLHARTNDREKVAERWTQRQGDRKTSKCWNHALPVFGENWRVFSRRRFRDGNPGPRLELFCCIHRRACLSG